MVDAGVVGDNQSNGQIRHWLVNGVAISGKSILNIFQGNLSDSSLIGNSLDFTNATIITNYAGPNPPQGDGPHRYDAYIEHNQFLMISLAMCLPYFRNPSRSHQTMILWHQVNQLDRSTSPNTLTVQDWVH